MIKKYKLKKIFGYQDILVPIGGTILKIAEQNGELCIWVDDWMDYDEEVTSFYIEGTGSFDPRPRNYAYLATIVSNDNFVYHIFMKFK